MKRIMGIDIETYAKSIFTRGYRDENVFALC